jgi:hypothetical protein
MARVQWKTYAVLLHGRVEPAPGSRVTLEQVEQMLALGRAEKKQIKDGAMTVLQYRMKDAAYAR